MATASGVSCADSATRQLLQQARQALGPPEAIDAIGSIQAAGSRLWVANPDSSDPMGFTILRPDAFQWNTGRVAHTLKGADFWQSVTNPPALQAIARENTERNAMLWSLLLLLDSSVSLPVTMKSKPGARVEGLDGQAAEFAGRGGFAVTVIFDRTTHRVAGFSREVATTSTSLLSATEMRQLVRVLEFRTVAGVAFPVKFDEQYGRMRAITTLQTVMVNPPKAGALFKR